MIKPTPADLGRRVSLKMPGNAPTLKGELRWMIDRHHAAVLYDGDRFPIMTDTEKLDWDGPRIGPEAAEDGASARKQGSPDPDTGDLFDAL